MTGRIRIAAAIGAAAILVTLGYLLPVRAWVLDLAGTLRGSGAPGVALFIAAYVLSAVAFVPGSILTLAAGFAYGPIGGLLVASPASVLASTAAFLLGRSALRDWVRRRLADAPRARALNRAVGRHAFRLVLLLRLSPLFPYNVLNYALSLTDVTLGRYVAASFLGMLPGTWLYVYLGSRATTAAELGQTGAEGARDRLILTLVGLIATVIAVALVTRIARQAVELELVTGSTRSSASASATRSGSPPLADTHPPPS